MAPRQFNRARVTNYKNRTVRARDSREGAARTTAAHVSISPGTIYDGYQISRGASFLDSGVALDVRHARGCALRHERNCTGIPG